MSSGISKLFDARHLDVARFAAEQGELTGALALADLSRLTDSVATEALASEAPVMIDWSVRGQMRRDPGLDDGIARPALWLRAQTRLPLLCQRCLHPAWMAVTVHRSFLFATDEAQAARLDGSAEDDVLALSRKFDLYRLIEDELLLALPLAPRHDVCPQPLPQSARSPDFAAADAERPHPFASLAALRPTDPHKD